jgi:hypothetical protein
VSRRASLPGAEELFRRTTAEKAKAAPKRQVDKSPNLQAVEPAPAGAAAPAQADKKAPKHDEKVTFYCTAEDLMQLEKARLTLRAEHGVAADRGRIVRAALAYVLEDFEARGEDSLLLRHLDQ